MMTGSSIEERLEALQRMTPGEIRAEWQRSFRCPPPPAFGNALMTRAIAAHYQEKALGGLSKAELRRLKRPGGQKGSSAPLSKPGTWLSRTWHGQVHEVVLLERGCEYRGVRYESLSAVARVITGARWSGPRFFGLHSPRLGSLKVTADV